MTRRTEARRARRPKPEALPGPTAGDEPRLLRLYERLCTQDPTNPLPYHRLAELLVRVGRLPEACRRLAEAAVLYARQGSVSKAHSLSEKVRAGCPDDLAAREILSALA